LADQAEQWLVQINKKNCDCASAVRLLDHVLLRKEIYDLEVIIVFGNILFSEPPDDLSGAAIHIQLLDTTMTDDDAVKLAEQNIINPKLDHTSQGGIQFCLPATQIDSHGRYEIWVHVDIDQSRDITHGDYLSTTSYPVPIQSGEVEMQVIVTRI
jgi:hypothetical protein